MEAVLTGGDRKPGDGPPPKTDGCGYVDFSDLQGGIKYKVEATLSAEAQKKYVWADEPGAKKSDPGKLAKDSVEKTVLPQKWGWFPFWVLPLARPSVKVLVNGTTDAVNGVQIKVGETAFPNPTDDHGIAKWPDVPGLLPGTHDVTLTLGEQAAKSHYLEQATVQKTLAGGDEEVTCYVIIKPLLKPRIKVVYDDRTGKPAPGVKVKLGVQDLGETGAAAPSLGLAEWPPDKPGIRPGDYDVQISLSEGGKKKYAIVTSTPFKVHVDDTHLEFEYKIRPFANLIVDVMRYDGKELLHAPAKFDVAGPTASGGNQTAPVTVRKDDEDHPEPVYTQRKEINLLDPGDHWRESDPNHWDYGVTLLNAAPNAVRQQTPKSAQDWEISYKIENPEHLRKVADGNVKVKLIPGETQHLGFSVFRKYREVQFLGFTIAPGSKDVTGNLRYLGKNDTDKDIEKRCIILKEAIETAYKHGSTAKDDPQVLKIFMAPEFYFRGNDAAYPEAKIPDIMDNMGKLTNKAKFADWLFVFGTAIGYIQHGPLEHRLKIAKVEKRPNSSNTMVSFVTVETGADDAVACARIIDVGNPSRDGDWKIDQGGTVGIIAKAKNSGEDENGPYVLELDAEHPLAKGDILLKEPDEHEYQSPIHVRLVDNTGPRTKLIVSARSASACTRISRGPAWKVWQGGNELEILPGKSGFGGEYVIALTAKIMGYDDTQSFNLIDPANVAYPIRFSASLDNTGPCTLLKVPASYGAVCARIGAGWKVTQGGVQSDIDVANSKFEYQKVGEYVLTLAGNEPAYAAGTFRLVEPKTTEVLNIALVQKGGPPEAGGGSRDIPVYKEYISSVDYRGDEYAFNKFYDEDKHHVEVHGSQATAIPTEGSGAPLGASPNVSGQRPGNVDPRDPTYGTRRISEMNRLGGGGCVFTVDDITFGLEICLDHAYSRLSHYYNDCVAHHSQRKAVAGEPKVQIHLIPSCGMSIAGGEVECVADGLVFNVDGVDPSAEARDNTGTRNCAHHPAAPPFAPAVKSCNQPCGLQLVPAKKTTYFCKWHPGLVRKQKGTGKCEQWCRYKKEAIFSCVADGELKKADLDINGKCASCGGGVTLLGYRCPRHPANTLPDADKCGELCDETLTERKGYTCKRHPWVDQAKSQPACTENCGAPVTGGAPLNRLGNSPEVWVQGLNWFSVTERKYYEQRGHIVVYEKKNMPTPDVVV